MSIIFSYVPGITLREKLAQEGALLRDRDVAKTRFKGLTAEEIWLARIEEGKRFLLRVVSPKFIERLYNELMKIHESGLIWNDLKYGNIIIGKDDAKPCLIDFENSRNGAMMGQRAFNLLRAREIEMFNLHFGS